MAEGKGLPADEYYCLEVQSRGLHFSSILLLTGKSMDYFALLGVVESGQLLWPIKIQYSGHWPPKLVALGLVTEGARPKPTQSWYTL